MLTCRLTPLSLAILGEEQSSQTNRADALRANMSAITRENFVVVRALIPLDQLGKTKDEILISRKIDDGEIMGKTVVDSEKDPLNFIRHRLIEQV